MGKEQPYKQYKNTTAKNAKCVQETKMYNPTSIIEKNILQHTTGKKKNAHQVKYTKYTQQLQNYKVNKFLFLMTKKQWRNDYCFR